MPTAETQVATHLGRAGFPTRSPVDTQIAAHRVKEFCERVRISPSTFWKYTKLGKIRVIRIGGRVLVPHEEALRIATEGLC